MPVDPVICQFSVGLHGVSHTVALSLYLNGPVFVRFEVNTSSSASPSQLVAVWHDGQWDVFEGDEESDPRHLLAVTLTFGKMLLGPYGRDWLLVRELLLKLTQAAVVHYR